MKLLKFFLLILILININDISLNKDCDVIIRSCFRLIFVLISNLTSIKMLYNLIILFWVCSDIGLPQILLLEEKVEKTNKTPSKKYFFFISVPYFYYKRFGIFSDSCSKYCKCNIIRFLLWDLYLLSITSITCTDLDYITNINY